MKRITLLLCIICICLQINAQKKEISLAKDNIKKGTNLEQAESSMANLLKDSANRNNEKIWLTLYEAQKKQYEQGNEKLYLKQDYDTAKLFLSVKKMFQTLEGLDSVDGLTDKKGRVKLVYRKKHAAMLDVHRRNLYNGGAYFVNKQNFKEAYNFFDMYLNCSIQPLFTGYKYGETDKNMPSAAYWAVYCGYKLQDPKATFHYAYWALKDTVHYQYMLQYLAETYKMEKDTMRYVSVLEEGFKKYPRFPFFFPRLIEYYTKNEQYDAALSLCDKALQVNDSSNLFKFTKSSVLLSLKRYKECIDLCDSVIAKDSTFLGAYLNAGLSYFNQAVEADKALKQTDKQKKEIIQLYKKALPYLEKYRKMVPDEKGLWGLPLYTIYLNLNMGKEFDEIDKLLK
ncbi:lipopolysaccharide assembly protein LapB [Prevotella sp. P5-64]|uniref:tetratricopeptide repeat protein n=1 Tax=Prevotella sp. P5-64 TaxID=2024226 RepID=UPI000B973A94|nr:hypothetical protein [Prevotella sp. P5-64]OYP70354.1 hypothetical protein CIK87_03235 [Prevotella sp. P5-64]